MEEDNPCRLDEHTGRVTFSRMLRDILTNAHASWPRSSICSSARCSNLLLRGGASFRACTSRHVIRPQRIRASFSCACAAQKQFVRKEPQNASAHGRTDHDSKHTVGDVVQAKRQKDLQSTNMGFAAQAICLQALYGGSCIRLCVNIPRRLR